MTTTRGLKAVLLGTALSLPAGFAHHALAQDQAPSCAELTVLVEERNLEVDISEGEIRSIIDANVEEQCAEVLAQAETAAQAEAEQQEQLSAEAQPAAEERERVTVEEEVVVEGEVFVEQQPPSINLEQPGPEVSVSGAQPEVTVRQQHAEILIRQGQPVIRLEMPQPTIRIEQPAPEIVITMPEPGVEVASGRPQVEVRQPEPKITVTQAPPQFDLEVRPAASAGESEGIRVTDRATGEPIPQAAEGAKPEAQQIEKADVRLSQGEATVTFAEDAPEPNVTVERSQPNVRFEQAEPKVDFVSAGEPKVEFSQVGEVEVSFREAAEGETKQARAGQREQQAAMAAQDITTQDMMVGDITGQQVHSEEGEEIAQIERVVRIEGQSWAVLSSGASIGLGDEQVPVELGRLGIGPEGRIILEGTAEQDAEAAADIDLGGAEEVPSDTPLGNLD